jgi:hypothetical protein
LAFHETELVFSLQLTGTEQFDTHINTHQSDHTREEQKRESGMLEIRCNNCSESLHNTCYRTICQHLYCELCACQSFQISSKCPVCDRKLHDGEVREVLIGIAPLSLIDSMFQYAFQTTKWPTIIENSLNIISHAMEISFFLQNQMLSEVTKKSESENELIKKLEFSLDEKVLTVPPLSVS